MQAKNVWGPQQWDARRRSGACGKRDSQWLCGMDVSTVESKVALLTAASPSSYDTRIADNNGGFVAAPAPRDQHDCNACVAMAVAAAADAALAKALGRNNTAPVVSARDLFFCNFSGPSNEAPDCGSGWELASALNQLTASGRQLPMERCLPFLEGADDLDKLNDDAVCQPTCLDTVQGGSFTFTKRVPLDTFARVQDHIRRYGGAVTRMWVPPGFIDFFKKESNRRAVWATPQQGKDEKGFNHAVLLVGYDNPSGYWLVWSSWGEAWGENGVARVKYGILDIAEPGSTYGLLFRPSSGVTPSSLMSGTLSDDATLPRGCQWYSVKRPTYLSKVAFDVDVRLDDLIASNSAAISDLGAWIRPGAKLRVCGAKIPKPVPPSPTPAQPPATVPTPPAVTPQPPAAGTPGETPSPRWTPDPPGPGAGQDYSVDYYGDYQGYRPQVPHSQVDYTVGA